MIRFTNYWNFNDLSYFKGRVWCPLLFRPAVCQMSESMSCSSGSVAQPCFIVYLQDLVSRAATIHGAFMVHILVL